MNATILPEKEKHYPVLLNEIISIITPQYGGTFIDCTFGQGGYTKKILENSKNRVIALDRDLDSKKLSLKLKKKFGKRFIFENKKFSQINEIDLNNENIKAVIFDLGFSYTQVKDLKKYTNLISELKVKEYKFKIIRHRKKDALFQLIFKNFKRN